MAGNDPTPTLAGTSEPTPTLAGNGATPHLPGIGATPQMAGTNVTVTVAPDVVLKKYSMELLTCLDEMRHKRDVLHKQILADEKEQNLIQTDLKQLTARLVKVNENLCDMVVTRNQLEGTITETEAAFSKLVSGTGNLLSFMKKVTCTIGPLLEEAEKRGKDKTAADKQKKTGRKADTPKRAH